MKKFEVDCVINDTVEVMAVDKADALDNAVTEMEEIYGDVAVGNVITKEVREID